MASSVYPLPKPVRAIGVPYGPGGTHSKEYNKKHGTDNWESENAVDLPTPKGTPVYAVAAGTIGNQIGPLNSKSSRMAGLRLHLVTDGNEFYYAHLSKLIVKAGQQVHAGQLLGYSGVANGSAHLHIAAKVGDPRAAFGSELPTAQDAAAQDSAAAQTTSPSAQTAAAFDGSVVAPQSPAPPTALGTPGPDVQLPGSVDYTISPHHEIAGLWDQAAQSSPFVSPDTLAMLSNAQLATGG